MKTDELVAMLARNSEPVAEGHRRGRFAAVIAAAGVASFVLMMATLGVRPDLADAARDAMFWVKLGFAAALAGAAVFAAWRLAVPGRKLAGAPVAVGAPVLAMALLALAALAGAQSGTRMDLVFGATWKTCPFNITMLSIPGVALLLWLTNGLAPTRRTAPA